MLILEIFETWENLFVKKNAFIFLEGNVVEKKDQKRVSVNRWTFLTSINHCVCKKAG